MRDRPTIKCTNGGDAGARSACQNPKRQRGANDDRSSVPHPKGVGHPPARPACQNPKRQRGANNAAETCKRVETTIVRGRWPVADAPGSDRGFTLVELIVVVGIIAVLAVIGLPGISRMLEDSRLADSETKIRGLLASARVRALNNRETGLFLYVENEIQKAVFIESYPDGTDPGPPAIVLDERITADRFRVVAGQTPAEFAKPFRLVPLHVLDGRGTGQCNPQIPTTCRWSDDELAKRDYRDLQIANADGSNTPDNHRNFFTVIFSPEGRLVIREAVFINDGSRIAVGVPPGNTDPNAAVSGAVTGLKVRNVMRGQFPNATNPGGWPNASGASGTNPAMICDDALVPPNSAAINFPSVDGLLVYDDSVFAQYANDPLTGGSVKRTYLLESGRPYYVNHQTGAVIAGPAGRNAPAS